MTGWSPTWTWVQGFGMVRQMDLANEIINIGLYPAPGAIAATMALAFGLGGRDVAARELEGWVQSVRSRKI
jgi:hypothetical protein